MRAARPSNPQGVTHSGPELRCWGEWLAGATAVSLFVVVGVLAARRFVGTFQPLPAGTLVLAAIGLSGLSWWQRLDHDRRRQPPRKLRHSLAEMATAAAILLSATVLTTPGSPVWALVVLWSGPVIARLMPRLKRRPFFFPPSESMHSVAAVASGPDDRLPSGVEQQMERRVIEGQGIIVSGRMRLRLDAGQRTASAHIGFCPPLPRVPLVAAQQMTGPPAEVRVGLAIPQGARLDVRLERPQATACELTFDFRATAPATSSPSRLEGWRDLA